MKKFKHPGYLLCTVISSFMLLSWCPINRASFLLFGEVPCPKCLQK